MSKELLLAIKLAKKSGQLILKGLKNQEIIKQKDVRDIETNLDLEVEKYCLTNIHKVFPGHNIIAEEEDDIMNNSDFTWVIDPIDGSKYLLNGIRIYTVSIGLWHKNKPYIGVIYNPNTKECYWAQTSKGAFLNGKKLEVSKISKTKEAIIGIDIPKIESLSNFERKEMERRLLIVSRNFYRFRVFGCGTLSLCYLAKGYFDAHFDLTGKEEIVDMGAGLVIAQEAGAKITDLSGKFPGMDCNNILITNGLIHEKVIELLK